MLTIDGSAGEGGGQVLRTSLALSVLTGIPFKIENIRGRRRRPGLLRQHLTGLRAAKMISDAGVVGDELKSSAVTFRPNCIRPGEYSFAVGTAGSANLVLQTVLPPLMVAESPSFLTLQGGTHNGFSPPFHYIDQVLAPLLARMGPKLGMELRRWGFYPAGGGEIRVEIVPAPRLLPLKLEERGAGPVIEATAVVSALPKNIAKRELGVLAKKLHLSSTNAMEIDRPEGPGNVVMVRVEHDHCVEMFTGFGQKGVPAERVAGRVATAVQRYLRLGAPVGEHLADQLLIPMALAGSGSFVTCAPTSHTQTNMEVIRHFLDVAFDVKELSKDIWRISIQSPTTERKQREQQ
jgi:RNA 3'-terminal phosphate cyclase (ATP)